MKKLALISGLAFLAGISAFAETTNLTIFRRRRCRFFGVELGERMPSDVSTASLPNGMLMAELEPERPEFAFQEYGALLHPKTRIVIGILGGSVFEAGERDKCDKAYARCKKMLEARFGKEMESVPLKDMAQIARSKTGELLLDPRGCRVKLGWGRGAILFTGKTDDGGHALSLLALNAGEAKAIVEKNEELAKSIPPLEGLFGRKLGEKVSPSRDEDTTEEGACIQDFNPKRRFLGFREYWVCFLPRSRKVFQIGATRDFDERLPATECFAEVCRLLEKKFKQEMEDASSDIDRTKPDEDGMLTIRLARMTFPNTWRSLEVECMKDVEEGTYTVRFIAVDEQLQDALEKEKKRTSAEKDSDAKALDAL